jgi:hypothetical protein
MALVLTPTTTRRHAPHNRYLGCANMSCPLCKHNPHKTCAAGLDFDEAYADTQVLRSRCDADVVVELVNAATGELVPAPGMELQVCGVCECGAHPLHVPCS